MQSINRKSRREDAAEEMIRRFDRLDQWWLGRDRGGERGWRSARHSERSPARSTGRSNSNTTKERQ